MANNRLDNHYHRVALIFPNFYAFEPFEVLPIQPPLGLGYLAGMLHHHNIPLLVIDAAAERLSSKKIIQKLMDFQPTIVGISVNIASFYAALEHTLRIKKVMPNVKIIFGGPLSKEQIEISFKYHVDIVVIGEGEYTLLELSSQTDLSAKNLSTIKGIAFLNRSPTGNDIIYTASRPKIKNLDDLPFPPWNLFPIHKYRALHRKSPFFSLMTSRGCPYDCLYCTKFVHGYEFRSRSINNIMKELEYLKSFNTREIFVVDDNFNSNLPRAKEILTAIVKANLGYIFQFPNALRIDKIDHELAKLLYRIGTYKVALAIETANQKELDFLQKKIDLRCAPQAVKTLKKEGLFVLGYFILGFPHENLQSMLYTIKFAQKLDLDVAHFFSLLVFPGTKLFYWISQHSKKFISYVPAPLAVNYHETEICFVTSNLNAKDVDRARLWTWIRFYFTPKYFLRWLKAQNLTELYFYFNRFLNLICKGVFGFRLSKRVKEKQKGKQK